MPSVQKFQGAGSFKIEVQNYDIGLNRFEEGHGDFRGAAGPSDIASALKGMLEDVAQVRVVLDDHDGDGFHLLYLCPWMARWK